VLKSCFAYNISVYGVGVGSAVFDRKFETPLEIRARHGRRRVLRHEEPGHGAALRACGPKKPAISTLWHILPAGPDRGAEYHSIEVRVKREGLTILAREGYYVGAAPR